MGNSEQESSLSTPPGHLPPKGKRRHHSDPSAPDCTESVWPWHVPSLPIIVQVNLPPHLIDTPSLYCTLSHALWFLDQPLPPTSWTVNHHAFMRPIQERLPFGGHGLRAEVGAKVVRTYSGQAGIPGTSLAHTQDQLPHLKVELLHSPFWC